MAATMMSVPTVCHSRLTTPARTAAFRPLPALGARRVVVRAEQKGTDNPLQKVADVVEEKAQGFVEVTQENSGLDFGNLGKQPGNVPEDPPFLGKGNKLQEIQSFSGLAPEIINGRAAMVGMVSAFGAELSQHTPVLVQIQKTPVAIAATFATIIIASLVPILRGANLDRDGAGPFNQRAEVWNGRTAMVAFALLLAVETFKAGPGLVP